MKAELVRIGNSRGIRIPKPLIEQYGFEDTVELLIEKDRLIITRSRPPRTGWREAFASVSPAETDPLLVEPLSPNEFDHEEWNW